jgi:hypothetical protein
VPEGALPFSSFHSFLSLLIPAPQTAISGIEGLPELLANARKEEPLDGWGGIKVVTEEDLKR